MSCLLLIVLIFPFSAIAQSLTEAHTLGTLSVNDLAPKVVSITKKTPIEENRKQEQASFVETPDNIPIEQKVKKENEDSNKRGLDLFLPVETKSFLSAPKEVAQQPVLKPVLTKIEEPASEPVVEHKNASTEELLEEIVPLPQKEPIISKTIHSVIENKKDPFVQIFGPSHFYQADLSHLASLKPDMFEPLHLDEAVSFALTNNFGVRSMEARSESSRWDRISSYSQYLPSVEFTYAQGAETSTPGSYNGLDGSRIKKTTHNRRDRSLQVRQPLLDLVIVADIMKSSDSVNLADIEKRDSQETTVFATVNSFLKLSQARKTIEMFDEHKKILGELFKRMQARFEEGGATNADLNRIQSRLNAAEAARLEALGTYGNTISEFKRLTQIVPMYLELPDKLVPEVPATAEEALASAWLANPSYLAAIKKIDVAQRDRDKSFASALPKLSVEYADVFNYNAGGSAHAAPVDGVYATQEDKRIMVVARWSLTGGTSIASGLSGYEKMREMRFKAEDVKARLEEGIHTAYDGLNAARKQKVILMDSFDTDKKIVSELEEQFIQGNRSLFEILDSQDRLHETKIALIKVMFAEVVMAYQIRMQMGEVVRSVLYNEAGDNGGR